MFALLSMRTFYRKHTESFSIAQGRENEAETRIRHKHLTAERGYLERGKVPEDGERDR